MKIKTNVRQRMKDEQQRAKLDRTFFNLSNAIISRAALSGRMGKSYYPTTGGGSANRDLYKTLGYIKNPMFGDYYSRYRRQDVAKTIVNAPVDGSWRLKPTVYEPTEEGGEATEFTTAWTDLVKRKRVYHYLARGDRLAGIGRYGVVLLGFDDVQQPEDMQKSVEKASELLYLRPYTEEMASIDQFVSDPGDQRYGMPEMYKLNVIREGQDNRSTQSFRVHWTRVVHIAEALENDDIYGTPRLENVLNRLHDLELLSGGSAEMFWRGAFPGYAFKADAEAEFDPQDMEDLDDEIQDYVHELRRYLRLQGVEVQQLSVQVASPKDHIDMMFTIIASATGIPKRILLGSERGELASSQDEKAWMDRLDRRRQDFIEPGILRPIIDRLISVQVLPAPTEEYVVEWPDMMVPSEMEEMEIAERAAKALQAYVATPGTDQMVPPSFFLKKHLKYTDEEIDEVESILRGGLEDEYEELPAPPAGGGDEDEEEMEAEDFEEGAAGGGE